MAHFTAISLTTTTDHIARIHRTGCEDIAKDLRTTGGTSEIIEAANGNAAAERYIAGELDEMGYSVADVRILSCAKRSAVSAAKAQAAVDSFAKAAAAAPLHTKACKTCDVDKSTGEFPKRAANADGISNHCRSCQAAERTAAKAAGD